MATVTRRKVVYRKRRPHPLEDAYDGDPAVLVGHQHELAEDPDLCERVFGSDAHEAFLAGVQIGWPEPPWRPLDRLPAVYKRSAEGLRIDFLEAVAWAIYRLERCNPQELTAFNEELARVRKLEWGERPWSGAKESDKFLMHVERMAEDFTGRPVCFRNRKHQPNPAVE